MGMFFEKCFSSTHDSRCVHARSNDFQPDFVLCSDNDVLFLRLVARRIPVGTELHVRRNGLKCTSELEADLGSRLDAAIG